MICISNDGAIKPGTLWKNEHGWQRSHDKGKTWQFSHSPEFYGVTLIHQSDVPNEDQEREVFGETMDEPIPDDLWEAIK